MRKPTDPPDNHYETFVWAIENGAPVDDERLLYEVAAAVGSLQVLNYLHEQWSGPDPAGLLNAIRDPHSGTVSAAALNGHVDVLEWLVGVLNGHGTPLEGVPLLHNVPDEFYERIVSRAANNSRDPVAVLRWCHEKGFTDFKASLVRTLILSHREHSLDVLKFLHSVNAPWLPDGESVKLAVSRNLLEKLKWLIEGAGCVWGENPLVHGRPYQDAYKWAEAHGAPPRVHSGLHEVGHVPYESGPPPPWIGHGHGYGQFPAGGPGPSGVHFGPPPGAMVHFQGGIPGIPLNGPMFGPFHGPYDEDDGGSMYDDEYDGYDEYDDGYDEYDDEYGPLVPGGGL